MAARAGEYEVLRTLREAYAALVAIGGDGRRRPLASEAKVAADALWRTMEVMRAELGGPARRRRRRASTLHQ